MLLSLDQEPCTPVFQGTRGHVLPAHMREEVIGSYQRGFGVARVFPFGASVGFVGAGATLCSGVWLVPWMCPGADIVFVIPRSPKEDSRAMEMRVLERDMMVGCLVRGLWSDCSIFMWEVYDEFLQVVPPSLPIFSEGIWAALGAGDVSCAWRIWSQAAEVSLRSAFQLPGEPSPTRVSNVVVESLVFVIFIVLVGPVVGKTLADFADHEDGQFDLYGSW